MCNSDFSKNVSFFVSLFKSTICFRDIPFLSIFTSQGVKTFFKQ